MSAVCKAYVRETPPPKQPYRVQETLHFRYLKWLVTKWTQVTVGTVGTVNYMLTTVLATLLSTVIPGTPNNGTPLW